MNLRFTNIFGVRQSVLIAKGACLPLILLSFLLTQSGVSAQTVTATPATLNFSVLNAGQTQDLTVTCAVSSGVTVDAPTITGANASQFQIISQHFAAAPAASSVVIRFTQTAAGNSAATLNIPYHHYNTATGQTLPGLTTVALTAYRGLPTPPASLDFGTVAFGQTKDLSFMGHMGLLAYIVGVSIAITGPNAGDFQIVSQNFVGSTGIYSVVVRFQPTGGGTRSATLSLKSDHPLFDGDFTTHHYSTTNVSLTGMTPPIPHTLLWQNSVSGAGAYWQITGAQQSGGGSLPGGVPPNWQIVAAGDITGDGKADLIWQDSITGDVVYW